MKSRSTIWFRHILIRLGQLGITSVILEGGSELIESFLNLDLIDEFYLYTSMNSNSDLNIRNPFTIDDKWKIKNKKVLDDDYLMILEKKEKCLQES